MSSFKDKNIVYGGDDGTDQEICHNARSMGEAMINKLRSKGESIVLVTIFYFILNNDFDSFF